MQTIPQPKPIITGKVEVHNWLCNGSINPLIRSYPELVTHTKTPEALEQALWYIATELEIYFQVKAPEHKEIAGLTPDQRAALFYSWRQHKNIPYWRKREILPGIHTPAQFLAKHGNLDCRAKCADILDLCTAISLTDSYNGFDSPAVSGAFGHFNLARYYPNNNPNTGRDAFEYYYGCECSSVIYIEATFTYRLLVMDRAWQHYTECTPEVFSDMVRALAVKTKADECNLARQDPQNPIWRLWWD